MIFVVDAIPYERHRRQLSPQKKDGLPYEGWSGGANNPSGGIPGAYYGKMILSFNNFYKNMLLYNYRYWSKSKLWWSETTQK